MTEPASAIRALLVSIREIRRLADDPNVVSSLGRAKQSIETALHWAEKLNLEEAEQPQ